MALKGISIRMYDVGWGDCFLLSFAYEGEPSRHMLIDFGTTACSAKEERERLMPIADDIATRCGGKLHVVVATHRHRDHIGGFSRIRTKCPGTEISKLKPELVIQPWTENPELVTDPGPLGEEVKALAGMDRFAQALYQLVMNNPGEIDPKHRPEAARIARQHYPNRQAVEALRRLGAKRMYVAAGHRTGLDKILPGVKVRVLGPARPGKTGGWCVIMNHPERESWQELFRQLDSVSIPARAPRPLFPNASQWHPAFAPPRMRWFIDRINQLRSDQILSLARAMASAVNDTSVVLMIEALGHKLLFPGDLELCGWARMLERPEWRRLLHDVTVYKASHHGIGNGTPQSAWELFQRRGGEGGGPTRMVTLVSARHSVLSGNERLSAVLGAETDLIETPALRVRGEAYRDIELEPQPSAPHA